MLSIQYNEFAASCASTDAYYINTNRLSCVCLAEVDQLKDINKKRIKVQKQYDNINIRGHNRG